MKELESKLTQARAKMTFSKKQKAHKRGPYPSVSVGNSFGGGSKVYLVRLPCFLSSYPSTEARNYGVLYENKHAYSHEPRRLCRFSTSSGFCEL